MPGSGPIMPVQAYSSTVRVDFVSDDKGAFLCGRSQFLAGYCYNLWNLAFPIEPPSSVIRPTLRDDH